MGRALNTGLLDDETAGDVEDYSRLGSFSDAIYVLGSRSLEAGIVQIQMRMGVIKNLLLVLVAGSIIWIYFASFGLQTAIADSMKG
jgi:toxin co-regulated pilus biosynthesis protein E